MASFWRHTVDTPVCLPVLVADGDAEAAIVGPNDLDGFLLLALYEQLLPLAGVASPDGCLEFSWNNKGQSFLVSSSKWVQSAVYDYLPPPLLNPGQYQYQCCYCGCDMLSQ